MWQVKEEKGGWKNNPGWTERNEPGKESQCITQEIHVYQQKTVESLKKKERISDRDISGGLIKYT